MAKGLTYRDAGVDIDEGDALVERIKPHARRTLRPGILAGIGGFGGLFEIPKRYDEPVMVVGTDGVGTKLKLAFLAGKHDTVGIDLVAMCVNDVVVCGAEPLVFLDYFATSKLRAAEAEQVIKGIAEGCVQAGYALIGGETAELPGFYSSGEYDLAGFCVGVVEKSRILDGSRVRAGDVVRGMGAYDKMLRTFNMGVGMCAVVRQEDADDAIVALLNRGLPAFPIGRIEAAPGLEEPEVVVQG